MIILVHLCLDFSWQKYKEIPKHASFWGINMYLFHSKGTTGAMCSQMAVLKSANKKRAGTKPALFLY